MPQDVHFPFRQPPVCPPVLIEAVNKHTLDWAAEHGLVGTEEAHRRYDSWDLGTLAFYTFPDAPEEALDFYTEELGFWFMFDDQFDGPLGVKPANITQVCDDLIRVMYLSDDSAGPQFPLAAAFRDLWRRSREGMSAAWCGRTAYHWERYFTAHAHEAILRRSGTAPDMDSFLKLRAASGAVEILVDTIEWMTHVEIADVARYSPLIQRMQQIATDIPVWLNDIYTLEREEPRGDTVNLVMVMERKHHCDRAQAVIKSSELINDTLEDFTALHRQVPDLARQLGLTSVQSHNLDRYAMDLKVSMDGYYQWERTTMRYQAEGQLSLDGPGYLEDLLGSRPYEPEL